MYTTLIHYICAKYNLHNCLEHVTHQAKLLYHSRTHYQSVVQFKLTSHSKNSDVPAVVN